MELSVFDRLVLLNVLPKEGDYTTLKLVSRLRERLSFSEAEHKVLSFRQEGDRLVWNEMPPIDIPIGEKATDLIVEAFKRLDREKRLTSDHVSLYERFVSPNGSGPN